MILRVNSPRQFAASCLSAAASAFFSFSDFRQRFPAEAWQAHVFLSTGRLERWDAMTPERLAILPGTGSGGHRRLKPQRLKIVGKDIRLWYLLG